MVHCLEDIVTFDPILLDGYFGVSLMVGIRVKFRDFGFPVFQKLQI